MGKYRFGNLELCLPYDFGDMVYGVSKMGIEAGRIVELEADAKKLDVTVKLDSGNKYLWQNVFERLDDAEKRQESLLKGGKSRNGKRLRDDVEES